MSDEETTTDELLREIVWSRAKARRTPRCVRPDMFGQYGAVVAVVADHDRRRPEAPAEGPGRVVGIATHAQQLRQELADHHPERFDAAAGINARRTGAPDPQLLALAGQVLTWLPLIATHDRVRDQDEGVDAVRARSEATG